MFRLPKVAFNGWRAPVTRWLDRRLSSASRRSVLFVLFIVCCGVAAIGTFVIGDLKTAGDDAQRMYSGSVHGLQQIGELQYDAQETRRATLDALTTRDGTLQAEYADQSRGAGRRVQDAIDEYGTRAQQPAEVALSHRLERDWVAYRSVRDQVLGFILAGAAQDAVNLEHSTGMPAFERVRQDLNQVKQLYDEDASRRLANLLASSRRTYWQLGAIAGFVLLLCCATVWVIQRCRMLNAIQLARLQMEFVASVSHELRTPLAVLGSAADNIADGLIEDKSSLRKYGGILRKQSRRMGELIDGILLFASTENGTHRYELEFLELASIVDALVDAWREQAESEGLAIETQIESGLPEVVGDVSGISQCLQNLVGNAIKYRGNSRRILIRAYLDPSDANGEVRVSVTDWGIGIESWEMEHIFDPFYRSPRVRAAQIAGTGLGLSLSKRIAESMGGRLSVVSQVSAGSTFTLHLQIARIGNTVATNSLLFPSPRP